MPTFEYFTFMCGQPELQDLLTTAGLDGWRLHTCDLTPTYGPAGSGTPQILVVLDRAVYPKEEKTAVEPEETHEGIKMT